MSTMRAFLFKPLEDDVPPEGANGANSIAPGLNESTGGDAKVSCHREMSVAPVCIPCGFYLGLH